MNYESTRTFASKVQAGVSFTIRKINVRRRYALEDLQAPLRLKLRILQEEADLLIAKYRHAYAAAIEKVKPERDKLIAEGMSAKDAELRAPIGPLDFADADFRHWKELCGEIDRIDRRELTPAMVKFCLVGIHGLVIDGEEATFESLLNDGPDDLYDELAREVAYELGISDEERTNLLSPSTSPAAVDGKPNNGNAGTAGTPATISPGAAESSTAPTP